MGCWSKAILPSSLFLFRLAQLLPSQRPSVLPVERTSREVNGNERLWMNSWMMRRRRVMPKRSLRSCRRSEEREGRKRWRRRRRHGNRSGDGRVFIPVYTLLSLVIQPAFTSTIEMFQSVHATRCIRIGCDTYEHYTTATPASRHSSINCRMYAAKSALTIKSKEGSAISTRTLSSFAVSPE